MAITETPIAKVVKADAKTPFKNVFDMTDTEFIDALEVLTTSGDILKNANNIYDYLTMIFKQNCMDSVLREWSFQWAVSDLGINYGVIYDKWLGTNDYEHKNHA